MNYALPHRTTIGNARRGGLLGIVVALHIGALLFILAAKTIAPTLGESPVMVHFVEAPKPEEEANVMAATPRPLPVAPPKRDDLRPVRPKPAPVTPRKAAVQPPPVVTPPLETTTGTEPAPAGAPVVSEPVPIASSPTSSRVSTAESSGGKSEGGELVGARFDADYLQNPAPQYPQLSRRLGEEGKVVLRVLVTAEGSAQEVTVKTSSGSGRLDESARRTVRQWKFVPAKRGGIAVESWVLVPIVFKLEE